MSPLARRNSRFSQNLFYREPLSDTDKGLWYFDGMPHRVIILDRLRDAPKTGHLTGETRKGGDALNALFDKMPEGNFIEATRDTPYFQIGESKYGKPIIDRVLTIDTPLEQAMCCALI